MGSEVLKINCLCNFLNFDSLHNFLSSFHDYKLANLENDNVVDLRIDGKNVRIKLTHDTAVISESGSGQLPYA